MHHPIYHYIKIPVANMYASPSIPSEVVSQALFSERIHVIEENPDWLYICTAIDHYQGWITKESVCTRKTPFHEENFLKISVDRCAAHLYKEPETIFGPIITLPFESHLKLLDPLEGTESRWLKVELPDDQHGYIQRGDVTFNKPIIDKNGVCELSHRFMGLPYTWGGRSSFGYDCSGFVQMLYRQMGCHLPRDAKDQVQWHNFKHAPLEYLKPADLLFFGLSHDKIRHVGLHLQNGSFIHAVATAENAPYIRISHISDKAWNGSGLYTYVTARTLA